MICTPIYEKAPPSTDCIWLWVYVFPDMGLEVLALATTVKSVASGVGVLPTAACPLLTSLPQILLPHRTLLPDHPTTSWTPTATTTAATTPSPPRTGGATRPLPPFTAFSFPPPLPSSSTLYIEVFPCTALWTNIA